MGGWLAILLTIYIAEYNDFFVVPNPIKGTVWFILILGVIVSAIDAFLNSSNK